jgi:undecaprenyl-diphosphatase
MGLVLVVPRPDSDMVRAVAVQSIEWGPLAAVMTSANWLADFRQALFAGVVIAILALFSRRSALVLLAGVPASIATQLLKLLFQRPRPPANVLHVSQPEASFGFPSGHATFYAWFVPLLVVGLHLWLPPRLRPPGYLLAGLIVLVGALARVWAGVHWPTDVLGGLLLGGAWAAIVIRTMGMPRRQGLQSGDRRTVGRATTAASGGRSARG